MAAIENIFLENCIRAFETVIKTYNNISSCPLLPKEYHINQLIFYFS